MRLRRPRTFLRNATVGLAIAFLPGLPAARAEAPPPAPFWLALWDLQAHQLIPLGRWDGVRFTDPWPPPRWSDHFEAHETCATASTPIPSAWWGDGGAPDGSWIAHDPEGSDVRFRIGASAVLSCDAAQLYWTPTVTPEPGFAWPSGRAGWLLATSAGLDFVPPLPVDERSREGRLVEARLRPTILRLERLRRAEIARAVATNAGRVPCSPDPEPLGDEPDLAWQIVRSAVPLGGRTPIHAEAWARGAVSSTEDRTAWGAPETFSAWLVECDREARTVSRRLRFADQGCEELDTSLLASSEPAGFFGLGGRLFAYRVAIVGFGVEHEILELRDDTAKVVLRWDWHGGC